MQDGFDPYRMWLGIPESIPESQRPPTHYQLLGVSPDERDEKVIDAAVLRQSMYVRQFQTGKYAIPSNCGLSGSGGVGDRVGIGHR